MTPDDLAFARLAELRSSAKGWHGVQLAALGFIGLCGVIKPGESSNPEGLQALSGILILVAFCCACLGVYYVAKAAWPIYGADPAPMTDADQVAVSIASAQLRRGLILTFLSIALTALATTSSWWPTDQPGAGGANVEVQAAGGQTVCGELAQSTQNGTLRVVTASQPVDVQFSQVASVRPVASC
jgi:drug/metabolite transporter (DMT)-like permease